MIEYTGLQYMKIDLANHMGLDGHGSSFEDRIRWVDDNNNILEDFIDEAKKPFLYASTLLEYRKAEKGEPTGHTVSMDSCASGIQMLSTLIGCPKGAENTGLIGQTRKDIYYVNTKVMNNLLGSELRYDKSIIKKALMTVFYASKMEPVKAFGKDTPELKAFHKAKEIVAPGASKLIPIMIDAWQSEALNYSCVMPDGHTVFIPVIQKKDSKIEVDELDHMSFIYRHAVNTPKKKGISLLAHLAHMNDAFIARELSGRCNYNTKQLKKVRNLILNELIYKQVELGELPWIEQIARNYEYISIRGVDYIDEYSVSSFSHAYLESLLDLIEHVLNYTSYEVLLIHDDFKNHPNHMNRTRQTYIETMAELAESDALNVILTQLTGIEYKIDKISDNLGDLIRKSEYAIS
jgi:hypothetical protein